MSFTYCSRTAGVNFTNIFEQLFCMKVRQAAYLYQKLGLIFQGARKISAKAARKMLVKLTTGWHQAQIVAPFFLMVGWCKTNLIHVRLRRSQSTIFFSEKNVDHFQKNNNLVT
jgi:hypothetical protein